MEIKRFNISKPKKYTDKQGVEKTQWNQVGIITEFHKDDGTVSRILEMPAIGLEASIFPFKPREGESQTQERPQQEGQEQEAVNPDDIPF